MRLNYKNLVACGNSAAIPRRATRAGQGTPCPDDEAEEDRLSVPRW